jgi:hypothetical protein
LDIGINRKAAIMYNGNGTRNKSGVKPNKNRKTTAITDTGSDSKAVNSIRETYVSG